MTQELLATGKPHISYSEMKDWWDCSYRHRLKYVDKVGDELDVPSIHLPFGKAAHAACEHFLNTKQIDLTTARKELDEAWEEWGDLEDFKKANKDELLTLIGNMVLELGPFLDAKFPKWELVKAEENLFEDFAPLFEKHAGLSFKGFIDAILKVPGKKGEPLYWVIDFKTASRPWGKDKLMDPKVTSQLVLYKEFWARKHGIDIKSIRCAFLTLMKKGQPGKLCHLIPISVGPVTINKSLTVINNSLSTIKRGIAIKNRSSCRWCAYKDTEYCT